MSGCTISDFFSSKIGYVVWGECKARPPDIKTTNTNFVTGLSEESILSNLQVN